MDSGLLARFGWIYGEPGGGIERDFSGSRCGLGRINGLAQRSAGSLRAFGGDVFRIGCDCDRVGWVGIAGCGQLASLDAVDFDWSDRVWIVGSLFVFGGRVRA